MVRAGHGHTLGIKTDGTLWAWGKNDSGALGDGTFVNKTVPTLISSTTDWENISCNLSRNIALKTDGTLWAWGLNSPALGLGFDYSGVTYITVPTQLGTDTNWKSAVVGTGHNLALKTDDTLWAWGGGNSGQCGNGTTTNNFMPTQVGTDTDWDAIEADGQTSFGVKTSGTLWAWGKNNYGQLGNNTLDNMLIPTQITTDNNWKSVSTSFGSTSVLKTDGSLLTWGFNYYGQLGDGTNTDQLAPLIINTCISLNTTDFLYKEKFILYPNPARNEVNIQFDSTFENSQLAVYDLMGRLVAGYQASEFKGTWRLDLEFMATGVYVVVMFENNQIIRQMKLQVL
jgi:alpha-tubulin suppressor-like RCC1 family protein